MKFIKNINKEEILINIQNKISTLSDEDLMRLYEVLYADKTISKAPNQSLFRLYEHKMMENRRFLT